MAARFLCGFLEAGQGLPEYLQEQNRCRTLQTRDCTLLPEEDIWKSLQLPEEWRPDFLLLRMGLAPLPPWVWSVPVPLVALIEDLQCLWHHHRLCLPHCAVAFAEPEDAAILKEAGIQNVRALDGLNRLWDHRVPDRCRSLQSEISNQESKIIADVLLVGLPHPCFERSSLARLRSWAMLGQRFRVVCAPSGSDELAAEIARARVVLVRSKQAERGWIADRAQDAGAVVLIEEETSPLAVGRFLEGEDNVVRDRPKIVAETVWERLLAGIEEEELGKDARPGPREGFISELPTALLLARCQHLLTQGQGNDPSLVGDLTRKLIDEPDNPALHVALGLATVASAQRSQPGPYTGELGSALEEFRRALAFDSNCLCARLGIVEALILLGDKEAAGQEARLALVLVERLRDEELLTANAGHLGQIFSPAAQGRNNCQMDEFACFWEQAGMQNAGQPHCEAKAKKSLLGWRLHQLLADLTGAGSHFFEAALCNPESPATKAALGSALARAEKLVEAASHLRWAVDQNPLDREAARNLFHALGQLGDQAGQKRVARDQWLLARGCYLNCL